MKFAEEITDEREARVTIVGNGIMVMRIKCYFMPLNSNVAA